MENRVKQWLWTNMIVLFKTTCNTWQNIMLWTNLIVFLKWHVILYKIKWFNYQLSLLRVDKWLYHVQIETCAARNFHPSDQREGGCEFYVHKFKWKFDIIIYPLKTTRIKAELVIFLQINKIIPNPPHSFKLNITRDSTLDM